MLFIFKMFPKISIKGFQPGIQGHSDNFVMISPAFCRQSVIALICWFQLSNFISSLWTFKIPVCSLFVTLWLCRYFLHSFKMSMLMQRPRQIWKQKFPTPKKGMWYGLYCSCSCVMTAYLVFLGTVIFVFLNSC